jgi:hypothetical protein
MQVVRLDVPLSGAMVKMDRVIDKSLEIGRDLAMADDFLKWHPTAKIIVVVDTHCLDETGFFIWGGTDAASYKASCLEDVCTVWFGLQCIASLRSQLIRTCIPLQVRKYLRTDIKGPSHQHRALVLNLACGASIRRKESRYSLYDW